MRLDRLDLTRYGHFTERRIDFRPAAAGEPDLHVVFGPNEAGKSTLFSAWLDLLFGIPTRSRNDFLHPPPTMQIGGHLSDGARAAEFRRVKKMSGSLLDAHDAILPEAVLHAYLGGLSREGYSAMFSLDDETLEKGGDSILASRGDLGEMLFAASAGLADLTPQLEAIRGELDAVYKVGGRKGALHDARKQLQELDRARKDLEVSASAIQKLSRDADGCETAWRSARQQEVALRQTLDLLRQQESAMPLRRQLTDRLDRMRALDHLPDAAPEDRDRFDRLDRERSRIVDRRTERAVRMQGLADELQGLCPDQDLLDLAPDIEDAERMRAAHDTALQDLPRRADEVREIDARLRATRHELGWEGDSAALLLPAAQTARMRELLAARSGVVEATAGAAAETRRARERLQRETEQLGDPGLNEDDGPLEAFLARVHVQQPLDARDRALRDRDQARGKLRIAIDALAPWVGDAETLATLVVPAGWQITAWEEEGEALRQQQADLTRAADDLRQPLAPVAGTEGGLTLADASAARSRREARWAEHRATLTLDGAQAFEEAMRDDDRIAAMLAEVMAAARLEAAQTDEREARAAKLAATVEALAAATALRSRLKAETAVVCHMLGLGDATLSDLRQWLGLRVLALTERAALRDAEDALTRADGGLSRATESLRVLLSEGDTSLGWEVLHARALSRRTSLEARRTARRTLTAAKADLREREQAEAEAETALAAWREAWAAACGDSPLSTRAWDEAGFGKMLDILDRNAQDLIERDGLTDRIAKMEVNRDRFAAGRDAILQALQATMPWAGVLARLRAAEECARDHARITRQIIEEERADATDLLHLGNADDGLSALKLALNCLNDDLGAHLDACITATTLRAEIGALRRDLDGKPDEDTNTEDLAARIHSLTDDLQLARDEVERCHGLHLEARRALEGVGGDDAVARIVEQRENLALEMRETARDHLAGRFGLMAFEVALRRYRDQHRSTMLTRASDAFHTLSRGAYTGLASQPDGQQDVLVALAASGGAKMAADLSKGTRFQLYLALRIAGYHELAQNRPTVPFIADDIMETFDDDRSAAAFSLLADMSRVGQVIYLTHHRHLCDIARDVYPGVNVIDLQSA